MLKFEQEKREEAKRLKQERQETFNRLMGSFLKFNERYVANGQEEEKRNEKKRRNISNLSDHQLE